MVKKESLNTILNLAYIYLNYGKTKRAIDYLLMANRISPNNLQIMKMQISAFRDIKAYPQALTLIEQLLVREDVSPLDRITLLLYKSLCLQGDGKEDEGKSFFKEYITLRKAYARKEYWRKVKIMKNKKDNQNQINFNAQDDLESFIKKSG